ncbi:hypothetical protein RRG08_059202 [Elysia crispata]|uniref:Uncharacterized protein n=1 Tax=Elysia crispata TaxID=231223 RepID=A0AAE0ZEK8_9GAST|nr:hypothetical protein RRG08_059202 [Elysia crispata]
MRSVTSNQNNGQTSPTYSPGSPEWTINYPGGLTNLPGAIVHLHGFEVAAQHFLSPTRHTCCQESCLALVCVTGGKNT